MISLNINLYLKIIILITYIVRHPLRQLSSKLFPATAKNPFKINKVTQI